MDTAKKTANYGAALKSPILASRERMGTFEELLHDRIAQRAFQFFEQGGRVDGEDSAHWFRAETEVLNLKPEIRDSKDSVMVIARVPDAVPQDVEICVGEHEAIIHASAERRVEATDIAGLQSDREELLVLAQWPWEVDPATASVSLKDAVLTLVAQKTSSALPTTARQ